ncbi:MAG: AraC family transcriptional regulator [Bacillota bacterium]|nr:AraC family transcriptional regulator [Bacillota bacterium]
MTVRELTEKLNLKPVTAKAGLDKQVTGLYICDLLSWVMSHAGSSNAWITVLTNLNTVAVALLTEISCIIIPEGIKAEETMVKRAETEDIAVLETDDDAYSICCKAYKAGIGKAVDSRKLLTVDR